jgi:phosphoserine phosphatase
VKGALAFDHVFSNELVFHNGRLIGYGLLVNANKAQILNTAFGEMLKGRRKVAVVDGANDIDLFGVADLKIAFNAQKVVREKADVTVDGKDLREIPRIISEMSDRRSG